MSKTIRMAPMLTCHDCGKTARATAAALRRWTGISEDEAICPRCHERRIANFVRQRVRAEARRGRKREVTA